MGSDYTFGATRSGISDVSRWARALDDVIVNRALELSAARIRLAWILASIVNAGFVGRTISIALAPKNGTGDSRISGVTGQALADGLMINAVALRVLGAGIE